MNHNDMQALLHESEIKYIEALNDENIDGNVNIGSQAKLSEIKQETLNKESHASETPLKDVPKCSARVREYGQKSNRSVM
jgi:hypothetical protein